MLAPYDAASKLEEIALKIYGPVSVLELLAAQEFTNKSSAMYLAVDALESAIADIDAVVEELMEIHREQLKSKRS